MFFDKLPYSVDGVAVHEHAVDNLPDGEEIDVIDPSSLL